ncbi:putative ripening-related protein 6 [Miscanthus floridulus]|uniref:putative ripening-related protein 6 n=1 Tax=Miscanthus floridulus TaxID=154761 RepID=UPI00345A6834
MAKANTAIVIVILALLQVSWATARKLGDHSGGLTLPDSRATADGRSGGTFAVMTVNGFQMGEDGGGAAACDGRFHSDDDLIVALSSGWYAGGKRCNKKIRVTSKDTGRSVQAQVVDECGHGCKNNIVDSSPAVWKKLGLRTDLGEVHVTWSDA